MIIHKIDKLTNMTRINYVSKNRHYTQSIVRGFEKNGK